MKMTPKFQQGGGFDSFFTIYKPVQTESPRRAPSSSRGQSKETDDDSDKGKLTEKDLFSMLKELDGLPNDMQDLVGNLMSSLKEAQLFGASDVGELANTYLSSLYKLKQAKFNKELFQKTYDRAVANGSLNDIAITVDGSILALDQNDRIVPLPLEDWIKVKNSHEYQPLTNSHLLWFRYRDPRYINNHRILRVVENGIGLEQVHQMIKNRFIAIKNNESSTDVFVPKEAVRGQQILEQMLQQGPEGYYKITTELSTAEDSQVKAALSYIYSTLPANAKTRLALETSDGTPESAMKIIGSMLFGTINTKAKHSAQYIGTKDSITGGNVGSNIEKLKNTAPGMFLAGLGNKQMFRINPGTSSNFMVESNVLPLTNAEDKPLGVQVTLQQVANGRYNGILDFSSVTMGGQVVDPMVFNKVVIPDGKIASVDFPCEVINGITKPRLSPDIVRKKEEADTQIIARGINLNDKQSIKTNYQIINQIYRNNGLGEAYNSEGEPIPGTWARFGVINGTVGNKALNIDAFTGNPLLEEDTNDYNLQNYRELTKTEEWDERDKPSFLEGSADVLYNGTIWIPLNIDYVSAYIGSGITMQNAQELDARTQALNNSNQLTLGRQLSN